MTECYNLHKKEFKSFTKEENELYFLKMKDSPDDVKEIEEMIMKGNINLIHKIINKYSNLNNEIEYDDLFQVGLLALVKCIRSFDVDKGSTFSTYAYISIERSLISHISSNQTSVSIPFSKKRLMANIKKQIRMDENKNEFYDNKHYADLFNLTVEEFIDLKYAMLTNLSLDAPIDYNNDENNDSSLKDFILDSSEAICIIAENNEICNIIEKIMKKHLTTQEYQVVKEYIWQNKTFIEIANEMNVSKQRIHQLYKNALKKLKKWLPEKELKFS